MTESISELTKKCSKCGEMKAYSAFNKNSSTKTGLSSWCRDCNISSKLKVRFGLTPEEYKLMFEAQNGVCYICGKPCSTGKSLHIDHDHETGEVRGLLCNGCNRHVIGSLKSSQIQKIYEYMTDPPARKVFSEPRLVPVNMVKPPRRRKRRATSRRRIS